MEEHSLFGKGKLGRGGVGVALYMTEQLKCMEHGLGKDDKLTERFWARIKKKTSKGGIVGGVCYRP